MANLKLTYFDFHGGRGETARLILSAGNIKFEDHRITPQDFGAMKPELPFGVVPVLHVDGEPVSQSVAIYRYVGRLAGLYPSKDPDALFCDEILEAVEDLSTKIGSTLRRMDPSELKAAREELVRGPIPTFLKGFEQSLVRRGPDYFVRNQLTVADVSVFGMVKWLKSGNLDHIPKDLVANIAPSIHGHYARLKGQDFIRRYYAERNVVLPE